MALILAAEASSANGTGGSLEDLEFSVLASRTMGEHGEVLINASIVVQNFGAVCSYVLLIGGLTTSMLVEWLEDDASADSVILPLWTSFYFVAPLMVLLFVLPPCLVRHFSNLRWVITEGMYHGTHRGIILGYLVSWCCSNILVSGFEKRHNSVPSHASLKKSL